MMSSEILYGVLFVATFQRYGRWLPYSIVSARLLTATLAPRRAIEKGRQPKIVETKSRAEPFVRCPCAGTVAHVSRTLVKAIAPRNWGTFLAFPRELLRGARWFNDLGACVARLDAYRKQVAPAYVPVTSNEFPR